MSEYRPPLRDMRFVIEEWLGATEDWAAQPDHAALDLDTAMQVLDEHARFAVEVLAPTNVAGDRQGCVFEGGAVRTPPGFREAYAAFVAAGWPALGCVEADGGQQLPQLLEAACLEMQASANHAWAMYPGLLRGAYDCLRLHAPTWIQQRFLPRIVSGEWLATMCLSEPQAGSDLALIRTRAEPDGDAWRLVGNKIFVSGGEQDLTSNIVHLVLARLPDAPAGTRGLSLFLAPKYLEDGQANGVHCDGLEHKMGIRGNATCAMRFEGARAWLIGEPHRGLAAMFVLMNSARLHVGLQGLSHAERARQYATDYARERRQMRAVTRPPEAPASAADPIQWHPPVRRALLDLAVYSEGMRAIAYWAAHLLDEAACATDAAARQRAESLAGLLTPVIKAWFSEQGFRLASQALQVLGGYGYVSDYGIEQTLRDSRISMIYEGSNEIQARDLLLRKVIGDGGDGLRRLLERLRGEARGARAGTHQTLATALSRLCDQIEAAAEALMAAAPQDAERPYRAAGDFLDLFGYVLLAYAWTRTARLAEAAARGPFYARKLQLSSYCCDYVLPRAALPLSMLEACRGELPFVPAE